MCDSRLTDMLDEDCVAAADLAHPGFPGRHILISTVLFASWRVTARPRDGERLHINEESRDRHIWYPDIRLTGRRRR
jgi:hypothetical protein